MLEDLTAGQYLGWLAWMRREQPYPSRDDWAWGTLLALTHNQWCAEGDARRPADYMPYHDPYEEEITAEEMLRRMGLA